MRARLWAILDGTDAKWGKSYGIFSNLVIITAIVAFAVSTLPDLAPGTRTALAGIEVFVLAVFAIDYFARLLTAPKPHDYAFSFWGFIDLVAWLPSVVLAGTDLSSARALRLIQVARVLKFMHLTRALDQLYEAVASVRDQLIVFVILTLIVLYLSSVGIYIFEHEAQPDVFASVPHSMWWAVATLSTVGYGDIYPITPGGRFFTGLVLLIGLAVIAVPTGLISAALVSKSENDADRERPRENQQKGDPE